MDRLLGRYICTHTHIHRYTDTQTHRHTDTQTYKHMDIFTYVDIHPHAGRQRDLHRGTGHRDTQIDKHTDTQGHRDTGPRRQTYTHMQSLPPPR